MSFEDDREGRSEFAFPYEMPFEVVIERVNSNQTVRISEHDGDDEDSPHHEDTTVFGEPYGVAGRPPNGVEYVAVATKSGTDWLLVANVDRPSISNEGNTIIYDMYESGGSWVVGSKIEVAGDIKIDPRSGQKTYTTGATYLGSDSAAEAMLLGSTFYDDIFTFKNAWGGALTTLKSASALPEIDAYCDAMVTALNNLTIAMLSWKSIKHKLDE